MTVKLVWNKSDCTVEIGKLTIIAAPKSYPPFTCQVIVEEQDTNLILGEQVELRDPGKPAWYLANTLEEFDSYPPGSVVTRGKSPVRLGAIVHDIEQQPTCTPEAVLNAYIAIMHTIKEKDFRSVALPLLGTVHGKFSPDDSIQLLHACTRKGFPDCLERLWLIIPASLSCDFLAPLRNHKTA